MKKWLISAGIICTVVLFLLIADYNHPVAKAERLCEKAYTQLQEVPAVRMEVRRVSAYKVWDDWKKTEIIYGPYWVCGENSLLLRKNNGFLAWDGCSYETQSDPLWEDGTWKISKKIKSPIWDESFEQLTHGQHGIIQHTEDGMEVRYRGATHGCCTGYYGEAVVFCFDKRGDLTAIGTEYVNYSHGGVREECVTSRHTTYYQITSLDEELIRRELEQQAEAILERVNGS